MTATPRFQHIVVVWICPVFQSRLLDLGDDFFVEVLGNVHAVCHGVHQFQGGFKSRLVRPFVLALVNFKKAMQRTIGQVVLVSVQVLRVDPAIGRRCSGWLRVHFFPPSLLR